MHKMENFTKYHFKDIREDEEILRVVHRDWFYIFEQFLIILAMFAALATAFVLLPKLFPMMRDGVLRDLFLFFESLLLLGTWVFSFLIWVDYYFDIWIITTHRIINIEQQGLFSRKVSELNYAKIQDVTTEVHGFIPTILNFGDVEVQTAGEEGNFVFRTVSDPYSIKNAIMQQAQNREDETDPPKAEL